MVGGDPAGYAVFGAASWKVWFVVETERDGMALWERLAPYGIGVMATGSAAMPPDARAHALLAASDCVVVALDNDAAGRAASWRFSADPSRFAWDGTYPQAVRWLVPREAGKDPGDLAALEAAGAPLSLREWALAGLPAHVRAALRAEKPALLAALDAEAEGEAPPAGEEAAEGGARPPLPASWTFETRCASPADAGRVLEATGTRVVPDGDDFRAVGGPRPDTELFWRHWRFFRRHGDLINRWLREEA